MKEILASVGSSIKGKYPASQVKSWIYKDRTYVLDIEYDAYLFAIDVIPAENDEFKIYFVMRDDRTHSLFKLDYVNKRTHIVTKKQDSIKTFLQEFLEKILIFIDKIYDVSISVIIPVYNREDLIESCISSINRQTLDKDKFEVIFVDDFSSDNSVAKIKQLIGADINHRILCRPINSGGAGTPRNDGIFAAKGKYVFFLDSDDYIADDCLENMLALANRNNSDMVYVKIEGVGGRGSPLRTYKNGTIDNANCRDHHLMRSLTPSKMVRTRVIRDNFISFHVNKISEDRIFIVEALCWSKTISILADKPYYYLVKHESNNEGGKHLSQSNRHLNNFYFVISCCLSAVFNKMLRDMDGDNAVITGFLSVILDVLQENLKYKHISIKEKREYFYAVFELYNSYRFSINKKSTYKEHLDLIEPFLRNDFESFYQAMQKNKD